MAMDGPAGGTSVHERSRRAAGAQEVHDQVEHLRVQDGRSLEVLSRRGRAGENEYARADDRADAERRQRPRPQRLFEPVPGLVGFRNQLVDGLAAEQLVFGGAGRLVVVPKGFLSPRKRLPRHLALGTPAGSRLITRCSNAELLA